MQILPEKSYQFNKFNEAQYIPAQGQPERMRKEEKMMFFNCNYCQKRSCIAQSNQENTYLLIIRLIRGNVLFSMEILPGIVINLINSMKHIPSKHWAGKMFFFFSVFTNKEFT